MVAKWIPAYEKPLRAKDGVGYSNDFTVVRIFGEMTTAYYSWTNSVWQDTLNSTEVDDVTHYTKLPEPPT